MKVLLVIALALLSAFCFSQSEGVVDYEETRKMTRKVSPQFADMVPKEFKTKMTLNFNSNESIYKPAPAEDNVADQIDARQGGGMRFRMRQMRANSEIYQNISENVNIEKQDFMGRIFLIDGTDNDIKWKMDGQQRKIAGYLCMKATHMRNDTVPVTAWWTPQIPISNGPGNNGKLPGLVLALDINNGDQVTVATRVELRALTIEEQVIRPEKGKEVTRQEFNKIRDEKMEEIREAGGGSRVRMRRN
jgi:GLPGLI family protein